jgi:hypothetical protein
MCFPVDGANSSEFKCLANLFWLKAFQLSCHNTWNGLGGASRPQALWMEMVSTMLRQLLERHCPATEGASCWIIRRISTSQHVTALWAEILLTMQNVLIALARDCTFWPFGDVKLIFVPIAEARVAYRYTRPCQAVCELDAFGHGRWLLHSYIMLLRLGNQHMQSTTAPPLRSF